MQTQGISFATSKVSSNQTSAKSTKASDSTFDSYITNRASKADSNNISDSKKVKVSSDNNSQYKRLDTTKKDNVVKDNVVKDNVAKDSAVQNTGSGKADEVNEEAVASAVGAVMDVLQNDLQLPMEDVQDLLDQAGIDVQDLVANALNGSGENDIAGAVQDLVMEFHGITDKAALLTSDSLNQEITTLTDQLSQVLSQEEPAESGIQEVLNSDNKVQDFDVEPQDEVVEAETDSSSLNVIVEKQTETESDSESFGEGEQSERTESTVSHQETDNVSTDKTVENPFVEQLSEAFEESNVESTSTAQQTMSKIVEQVVTQVRIRVMPETTSMELQLHPASLGRVNIQVATSAAGVSTATMTVENEAAKAALESQMITLKETFEEQGLKVDAVEVTVSEFGLDHQDRENQQQQQKPGSRHRRFDFDEESSEQGLDGETRETIESRRNYDSTVDYTA
jgi:flagellar hook-length control protein FliK